MHSTFTRRRLLLSVFAAGLLLFCSVFFPAPVTATILTGQPPSLAEPLMGKGVTPGFFWALGGHGEEAALTPKGSAEQPLTEQFLGGSYLGALLFGYPATGLGGADLVALAFLAYLLLRSVGARKASNDDRRFTLHTRDDRSTRLDENGTPPGDSPRPPRDLNAGSPRDNAWSRRLKGEQNREEDSSAKRDHPFGDAPFGRSDVPQRKSRTTVKDRADAMWAHLSSQQQGQPEERQAAITEGAHVPAGFDVQDFLDGARTLYIRLQKAWAARKIDDIAPFITEGMLTVLKQQAKANPEPSDVDIVLVNATLQDVGEEPGQAGGQWADVHFAVLMRASGEEQPAEINERWRFVRGTDTGGMWRLSGIEAAE